MNYSEIIRMYGNGACGSQGGYLCSGSDMQIAGSVLNDILHAATGSVAVVDDSGVMKDQIAGILYGLRYAVTNGFARELCYQDILDTATVSGMSRIRTLLFIAGFQEMQVQKVVSYLSFVKHVEVLAGNWGKVSLEVLAGYSTNMGVERRLENLRLTGRITQEQQLYLVSKYSEAASAAADFEHALMIMGNFITGKVSVAEVLQNAGQALYIPLYTLGRDTGLKKMLMEMLNLTIADGENMCHDVIVMDNGRERSDYLSDFLQDVRHLNKRIHVISQDFFLADQRLRQVVMHSAGIRVYSRHSNMDSCAEIERLLGDMDVVKQAYGVDYPRQWKANSPWDILLGNNKTEHYNREAPVREPKYRKEDIHAFPQGIGIVECNGNSSIFSLC